MKQRFIYISLLFLLFAAKSYAQPRYVIAEQALCWNTGSQDSSITRYLLITSQGALDSVMTLDQYGNPVTVTGGTITFGHCGCCNGGGGGGGTDTNIYNSSGTLTGNRFVSGDSLYSLIFYNIDSLLLRQAKLILGNPNNQIKYTTYDGYQGQVLGYDAGGDSTYWTHTIDTAFVSNDTLFIVIPSDTIVIPQAAGWLATYLPTQNVVIGTNNHSLIFTNGNIFSWATDTTSGNWIMQGYLDPSLSGGVGQWGARNDLTGKRYGMTFSGATGTTVWGYPTLYLANNQVQDSILNDAYTYVPTVQAGNTRTGAIDYVRIDSLNTTWLKPELEAGKNVDINSTTQTTMSLDSVQVFVGEAQDSIYINRRGASTYGTTNLLDMQGYFNSNLTSRYRFSDPGYFYMQNWGNTVSEAPRQYFGSARGTKSSPSALQNGDNIGITFYQDVADAPSLLNTAKYAVIVKKDTTYNGLPTGVMWFNPGENNISTSTLIASPYTRMVINRTGVGIGAPIYPKARLHLNGTFRAEGLGTSTSTIELLGRDANKDVFPVTIGSGLSLTSGTLKTNAAFCNTAVNEATNLGIGVASVNLNTTSNFNGDPTTYTVGASSIQLLNAGVYTLTVQFSANFSAGDELTIAPTLTGGSVGSTIQTLSFAVPTAANYGNTFTFPIRVITAPTTLTVAVSRTATIAAESVNSTISLNKNY